MYETLLYVISGAGGGVVIACGIFKAFGNKWLEHYFKRQLEDFKTKQKREIQNLNHEINSLFSRISKIHEKEFEILPEAWKRLHIAFGKALHLTRPLKSYPDFKMMSNSKLEEFIKAQNWLDYEKDELRNANNKQEVYEKTISWKELLAAENAQIKLNNYLIKNSIFMPDELSKKFSKINASLQEGLNKKRIGDEISDYKLMNEGYQVISKLSEEFDQIKLDVKKRLRYEDA